MSVAKSVRAQPFDLGLAGELVEGAEEEAVLLREIFWSSALDHGSVVGQAKEGVLRHILQQGYFSFGYSEHDLFPGVWPPSDELEVVQIRQLLAYI